MPAARLPEPAPLSRAEAMTARSLDAAMTTVAEDVDALFDRLLAVPDDARAPLYRAMRHAAIGGGKRLRPLLLVATADRFAVDRECSGRAAVALEAIHVYSLIHDDLPAMDDDDVRRGKPTVHKLFDEATAILAGDCLHALAFELLGDERTHADPFVRAELVLDLARAAGPAGMAGGQAMDLEAERSSFDLSTVTRLQALKTGALIAAAVEAGAILGRVPPEGRTGLRGYARDIGLAFQIADDLLDVEGDVEVVGKATGKDADAGKATFVSLLGVDRARTQARVLVDQWASVHGPAAALMHVWMGTPPGPVSPGTAVVSAPLRRSRTAPSLSGITQPMQMPIRHPLGMRTPALSATSRIGEAPSASTSRPSAKVSVPPSPATTVRGRNRSTWSVRPRASWCSSSASRRPTGPQA